MFRNLRLQLTLLYLLASFALMVLPGGGIYTALKAYFQRTTDLALQHKMYHEFQVLGAPVPAALVNADLDWSSRRYVPPMVSRQRENIDRRAAEIAYTGELAAIFVLVLDADGKVLFNPSTTPPPIEPVREAVAVAMEQGYDWRTTRTLQGTTVRLLTYRVTRNDGPAVLQVGRALDDQERVLQRALVNILVFGSIGLVVMGFGSWWLAGRSLVPVQQAWERQQRFIANASHELRAPLTLMRASAEVARRSLPTDDQERAELLTELLDDVLHECDHMNRMVENLLLLSRLDAGKLTVRREVIALPDVLADMQRQVGRLASERGVHLVVEDQGSGTVWGDSTYLRQVLLILLDNALRHTPPGGTVRITTSTQGPGVAVEVSDTGSGIAAEHLPHIFERFYRPDCTRGTESRGAGLGLSIARALVMAQQGSIVAASEVGVGTRMRVVLEPAPKRPRTV
ncbi:MAG: histidine kinase [Chloroflexaceae bacterium]|nr:histidine kinase [Chloroflexaceae bacterium]